MVGPGLARESPASTTVRTPGTVSDDSATAVDTTTRRRGPAVSARSCSAARQPSVQRPYVGLDPRQASYGPVDLGHPGHEHQHVPGRSRQRATD